MTRFRLPTTKRFLFSELVRLLPRQVVTVLSLHTYFERIDFFYSDSDKRCC